MGRIITVASAKGGVGKTTTVLNLGHALSRFAGRVLLLDADPQGGLAHASALEQRSAQGVVDVLSGRASLEAAVTPTRDPALQILGSGPFAAADVGLFEEAAQLGTLERLVSSLGERFDCVLVDAPAGLGPIVRALFAASDGVLVPVTCRSLSVKTLPDLLRLLAEQQGAPRARPLALEGILVTMRDILSRAQWEVWEQLRSTLPAAALLRTVIPQDEQVERASLLNVPVALLPEAGRAASAYLELALELRAREQGRVAARGREDGDVERLGLF